MNESTVALLKNHINNDTDPVRIVFTKKDGSEREMFVTTNMELIPTEKHPKQIDESDPDYKPRKVNENVVPVFDVDAQMWKSFLKDNLISVNGMDLHEYESWASQQ